MIKKVKKGIDNYIPMGYNKDKIKNGTSRKGEIEMLIRVKETGKVFNVTLKSWEDGQYTPDMFSDLEVNVPVEHEMVDDAYEMPQAEFDGLVDYWESECADFNEGRFSEQFGDREEVGHDREFALFVDEI